jgi:hypothetical protein
MPNHLGTGLDGLLAELESHAADGHEIAVAQSPLADPVAVDHRAVGRVAVPQEVLASPALDDGVSSGDHRVGKHEVVRGIPTDGQDLVAGEGELTPIRGAGIDDDEPGHPRA